MANIDGGVIKNPTWPDGCPLTLGELASSEGHTDCELKAVTS